MIIIKGYARRSRGAGACLRLLCAALVLAGLASCATIQRDVLYDSAAGGDPAELAGLEQRLTALRAAADQAAFAQARGEIKALLEKPSTDPLYRARLSGLAAEAALLAGDRAEAAKRLAESRAAYQGDEYSAVVASRLARTNNDKLKELEAALLNADGSQRIRAEMGATLHDLGRHREALAAFDAALPFLPDEYRLLYGPMRERAYALREADANIAASSAAYLNTDQLPALGMAVLAQSETNSLDWITGGASWAPGVLFERLKAAGWYADSAAGQKAPMYRKDAALFLWNVMARGEARLLTRYSARYAARPASPVPDVPIGSPWFDAVLGFVEEGIMSMPDGRSFKPDDPVNGLDFYAWLKAAAAWR
jgi:hypothetical protein